MLNKILPNYTNENTKMVSGLGNLTFKLESNCCITYDNINGHIEYFIEHQF
jgi:hypothetical protein